MTYSEAYVGTAQRTFSRAIVHLLETSYGLLGSRRVLDLIAQDIKALTEQFYPAPERLQSGWMVFTGVKTSGQKAHPGQSGADHELVTLAWPILLAEDLDTLVSMPKGKAGRQARQSLLQKRIARIVEYGWQHPDGPVLLTLADLSAMLSLDTPSVSDLLKAARKATGKPLLTKGYYFDQGVNLHPVVYHSFAAKLYHLFAAKMYHEPPGGEAPFPQDGIQRYRSDACLLVR